MKSIVVFSVLFLVSNPCIRAQVFFKTEYFGTSSYRMSEGDTHEKVGRSKGSSVVYQAGVNLPLSRRMTGDKRPIVWGMSLGGSYVHLNNRNFTEDLVLDEIMNLGLSVHHLRPVSKKWSLLAMLGAGVYAPATRFSEIRFNNVLGSGGAIFICHLTSNLDLGGGIAVNNSFGYPMAFPAFYLDWKTSGKIAVKVSMLNGLELGATYTPCPFLSLSVVAEMNGQMALAEKEGEDQIFTHQYLLTGLRPEIRIGKRLSIPLTLGIHAMRTAEFRERSLKAMFRDRSYYFQASPYASAGLRINL